MLLYALINLNVRGKRCFNCEPSIILLVMKITFALIAIEIKLMCVRAKYNAVALFHLILSPSFYKRETTTPFYLVKSIHTKCYGVSESPRHKCQIPNKSSCTVNAKKWQFGEKIHTHKHIHGRAERMSEQSTNQPASQPTNRSTTNQTKEEKAADAEE